MCYDRDKEKATVREMRKIRREELLVVCKLFSHSRIGASTVLVPFLLFAYLFHWLQYVSTLYLHQVVEETALGMQERIPKPLPLEDIMKKYPVKYEESMNTVLVQEVS